MGPHLNPLVHIAFRYFSFFLCYLPRFSFQFNWMNNERNLLFCTVPDFSSRCWWSASRYFINPSKVPDSNWPWVFFKDSNSSSVLGTALRYLTPFNIRPRGWPKIREAESLAFFGWPKIKGAEIFPKPLYNSKQKRKKWFIEGCRK